VVKQGKVASIVSVIIKMFIGFMKYLSRVPRGQEFSVGIENRGARGGIYGVQKTNERAAF
jgi:hypothetical protein